jgi:hypothetical protein
VPSNTSPPVPNGRAAVIATFGDISKYIRVDGTLSPKWEQEMIRRVTLPKPLPLSGATGAIVRRVTCHKLITDVLRATLQEIDAAGKWSALHSYGGGFVFRLKRTVGELSLHSWGIAWDFDPEHNQQGTAGSMDTAIVQIFSAHGLFWGGNFQGTKDPMHFQYATGT